MPTREYQQAFNALKDAIETRDILKSPDDFQRLVQTTMGPKLNRTAMTGKERYRLSNELVQLVQSLKAMEANGGHAIRPVAIALAALTLLQLESVAQTIPVDQLGKVLADMQKIAFYVRDDSHPRFSATLVAIEARAPDLARISDDTHCVWFTGKPTAGKKVKDISSEDLGHVAKHVLLYQPFQGVLLRLTRVRALAF